MNNNNIAIIGLGYVGLPLAIEFGKYFKSTGFDFKDKIFHLKNHFDPNFQITKSNFIKSKYLNFSSDFKLLKDFNYIIVSVPTPINKNNKPNLEPIKKACIVIGKYLQKKTIIIFESTVYPGLTEEYCVPIIEKYSNFKWKKDFNIGYSPERINPGDKVHTLKNIVKVVSGDNNKTLNKISLIYKKIISAGIYKVKSIKIAEAAKVIENTQRDLNISLMNELSIIFNKMNIDTDDVLKAANTKWNFLDFKPGLVGGHCIGVDPYYLTYKSKQLGYLPKVILSGRKINDNMGKLIANDLYKHIRKKKTAIKKYKVLILGFTFKENCKDSRNTKVIDIYYELIKLKCKVDVFDPIANKEEVSKLYNLRLLNKINDNNYDGIIIAVSHKYFIKIGIQKIRNLLKKNGVIFDVKSIFNKDKTDIRL